MTERSVPQQHSTLAEQLPSAARKELIHLMFALHLDYENWKQRAQACSNVMTASGMPRCPSGTGPKYFHTGHQATIWQ